MAAGERTYEPGFRGALSRPDGRPPFFEPHWSPSACPECEGELWQDEHDETVCANCGLIISHISLDPGDPAVEACIEKTRAFREHMKAERRNVYSIHGDSLFNFETRNRLEDLKKIIGLLSDHKPRTYAEIDKSFSWPHRTAERTINAYKTEIFNVVGGGRRGKPVKVTLKVQSIASDEV
jgi:hypothetical protein